MVEQVNGSEVPNTEPQSLESRIKLRENLLTKEKKELIIALEGLKKRANYAKDKMIVLSNSNQHKGDAADAEEEYLTANLELVQVKKRLTTIETETRELRLFASQHREVQEEMERPKDFTRSSKPPLLRRASKEIKIVSDIISPPVDKEAFNPEPQIAPTRKVMDNVKVRFFPLPLPLPFSFPVLNSYSVNFTNSNLCSFRFLNVSQNSWKSIFQS